MRREPERTCVGCRGKGPKRTLLRVAATPDGCRADPAARVPGRGCYVHRRPECVDLAVKRGAIVRALGVGISADEVSNLLREIELAPEEWDR